MSLGLDRRRRRVGIIGLALIAACVGFVLYPFGTFPVYREFVVTSINGQDIPRPRPTFQVGWLVKPLSDKTWPIQSWATGWTGCNGWSRRVLSLWGGLVVLGDGFHTALACRPRMTETEDAFDRTLPKVRFWRRDGADIILEGDDAVMGLVPSRLASPGTAN